MKCSQNYDFPTAIKILISYFKLDLRCGYLEQGKIRLYFEAHDSFGRRSVQTCLYYILDTMVRLIAPVLSFLAEEVLDAFKVLFVAFFLYSLDSMRKRVQFT